MKQPPERGTPHREAMQRLLRAFEVFLAQRPGDLIQHPIGHGRFTAGEKAVRDIHILGNRGLGGDIQTI